MEIMSGDPSDSLSLSHHKAQDSLDSDLGRLSEAIFHKRKELESGKGQDSRMFTLNDSPEYMSPDDFQPIEVERLGMQLEDCLSLLSFRIFPVEQGEGMQTGRYESLCANYLPRHSNFDFSQSLENIMTNYVECSLMDLYQLIEDVNKIILQVEAAAKFRGRLTLGNFKLDVKVIIDDSPIVEKEDLEHQFHNKHFGNESILGKSPIFQHENPDFSYINSLFSNMENTVEQALLDKGFDAISDGVLHISHHTKEQSEKDKNYIMMELEYGLLNKIKLEEEARIKELEWQCLQAKSKKSYYFNKNKRMNMREDELRKFSKNISEQTVKNAKERESLEQEFELLEQKQSEQDLMFSKKIDVITKVLQEIEDTRAEVQECSRINTSHCSRTVIDKHSPRALADKHSSRVYEAPSITKEIPLDHQIKAMEQELTDLEIEYKTSKIPETLESIQTSITRVKSSLLNLQSLKAIKKTERTSSTLRNAINRVEKHWENTSEPTTGSRTGSSNNTDSDRSRLRKAPNIPSRSNIMLSPLRKLEANTSKLDCATLNSPSRRKSPMFKNDTGHSDVEMKKYLRKKEEVLRDREDEILSEEFKLQEVWKNTPQGKEMIPVIQVEIFEYRKLRQEYYQKRELLEREKYEWAERNRVLVQKERELVTEEGKYKDQLADFEKKKIVIGEKLEWLKNKLSINEL